jgi:type IV pilus assembly protein PilC
MTEHYEKDYKLNSKVKSAMVYPAFLAVAAVGVVIFMMTFILPTFVSMFESSSVELPGITKFLLNLSSAMTNYWYLFLGGTIAIVVGTNLYSKTETGELVVETIKLNFPGFKNLNKKIITSRFTQNLSIALFSGVTMIDAIEIVSALLGNKFIQKKLMDARAEVIKGETLSDSLEKMNFFPSMMVSMVGIGEESGSLDDILEKTAEFYDREVEDGLSRMVTMIEPLMIIIMGGIVGFIVLAIALPMFDMYSTI